MRSAGRGIAVAPFRALRYDRGRLDDPGAVWAPPYDVISTEEAESLRRRHARNIVRLTLPEPGEPDRYTLANRLLRSWIEEGTLVREPEPAVFVHRHHFTTAEGDARRRTGVWALVRLVPLDAGLVLPHERTLSGPKADRISLMRATRAQLSAVFMIASDPEGELAALLATWTSGAPERGEFPRGERHEIWRVRGGDARELSLLADQTLLIADGHHRYETALTIRDELIADGASETGRCGHEFVLAHIVSEKDPGLCVYPTHRVLAGLPEIDWEAVVEAARDRFSVQEVAAGSIEGLESTLSDMAGRPAFVLICAGGDRGWRLELEVPDRPGPDAETAAAARLASTAVHDGFLPRVADPDRDPRVQLSYTRDAREAIRRVRHGSAQAAVLLASSRIDQIRRAAEAGARLPPKTTFFWPKVPTGPALYPIDPSEEIDLIIEGT